MTSALLGGFLRFLAMAGAVIAGMVLVVILYAAERERGVVGHLGIWITQLAEVSRARTNVEVAEQRVVLLAGLGDRDLALRIKNVAEDDRLDRTNLLAGRLDHAIGHDDVGRSAGLRRFDLDITIKAATKGNITICANNPIAKLLG